MPYTYLIGWSKLNKWYYGVRFAKNCVPVELWVKYKTSSIVVKEFVLENGDPDIIQIRKTFSSIEKARQWETKVLRRLSVIKDEKWLNQTDNISILLNDEIKEKIKRCWKNKSKEEIESILPLMQIYVYSKDSYLDIEEFTIDPIK